MHYEKFSCLIPKLIKTLFQIYPLKMYKNFNIEWFYGVLQLCVLQLSEGQK